MNTTTLTKSKEFNWLVNLAFKTGCEPDQMERFIQAGYWPQPKQMMLHAAARECNNPNGPDKIAIGGTRGQAKSHCVLAQAVIDDMQQYSGLKVLYLRKIKKKAAESFEDLRRKVLARIPHTVKRENLYLPSGSFAVLGGFRSENDIDDYLGLEYDLIVLEDATALTEKKYKVVRGSLRTSRDDWRPRLYASFNPAGVGHAWAQKEFWYPYVKGIETDTRTRFIHVTMGDNVFINKEYEDYLNSLTGWLRWAWRDGDMSKSAGAFFSPFDERAHVIDSFGIPYDWQHWASLDYGFGHWNMTYVIVKDNDGNYYVIAEHGARKQSVKQNAKGIKATFNRYGINRHSLRQFVAGHDVFIRRGNSPTIAESYAAEGIHLTSAVIDRVNGAARVLELLGNPDENIAPRLFIFRDRCPRLIECLPQMQHDPNRMEDVLKIDCDSETGEGGDDPYDGLRYALMVDQATASVQRYK